MRLRTLCLVLFVGLCARPVAAAPILSIEPGTSTVNQGDTFFLDINITGVTDLYGFQFDVLYDPTILTANDITEGAFLPSGGFTFFIPADPAATPGNLGTTYDLLLGPLQGVSGDGTLARISFTAASGGPSSISLSNLLLQDSVGNIIDFDTQTGTPSTSVDVNSTAPVPEPGTLMLVGSGIAMAWRKRRHLTGGMA
jgi:hypothetical protein